MNSWQLFNLIVYARPTLEVTSTSTCVQYPQAAIISPDYIVETLGVRTMAYHNPGQSWPPLQKHFPNIYIIPPKWFPNTTTQQTSPTEPGLKFPAPTPIQTKWPADQARQDTVPTASHVGTVPPLGSAAYASASCKSTGRLGNWKVHQISYWNVLIWSNMVWDLNLWPNIIVPIPVYYEFISDARLLGENSCFTEILSSPKFIPPESTKLGTELRPLSSIQNLQNPSYIPRL